ncbi:MAG: 4Fe-4S dicluster domain-containing protein, partial [Anaerolineae bacterium]|nr:4Fe-4S dicluster domain-containing protein [Anaerolineae bacterium]
MSFLEQCRRSLHALAYLLPSIGRALVAGPETVKFPFAPAEISEDYRGRIEVNPEICRGCGLCARDCPAFALELQRKSRDEFKLIYYPERCAYCGQCETSCNFGALTQTNTYTAATTDLSEL